MNVDEDWTATDEVGASLIAYQTLFHSLCTTMLERGLLSLEDVDQIYHDAASGLEDAERASPGPLMRRSRAILERVSSNRARTPS
jgi:hypothetical protein